MHRTGWREGKGRTAVGVALALVLALAATGARPGGPGDAGPAAARPLPRPDGPPCPAGGRAVPAGTALQPLLDAASPGSALCLSAGDYAGPLVIRVPLTLQGPAEAIIRSNGEGATVRALADSVALLGFTVDGSGHRYDLMDAAVYLRGEGLEARGLAIRSALFGIVAERSHGVVIADNHVVGDAATPVGIRGDGIRLWEVRGSRVQGNVLKDSRDIVVWYSPGNRIAHNTVLRSRYATHFMYSDDCVVEGNDYHDNIVGVFIMYSRGITLRDNVIMDNAVPDAMGLGVKESGNLVVEGNRFVRDRDCIYLDTSPFREGDTVAVRNNVIARCSAGVTFHSSEHHNAFLDNAFQANQTQVAVEGRGTAADVVWRGNYFDDYQGYDLDGDGYGDVAYELRDLSERLVSRHPSLAFFRGTIALELVDVAARVLPLLQPTTLLTDERPRMARPRAAPCQEGRSECASN